jgi:hypothetical protein
MLLDFTSSNWWVLVTAVVAGAVGGLAAALILLDPSQSPSNKLTGKQGLATVAIRTAVGAAAAVGFLFFFPTEQTTTVVAAGHAAVTATEYPFLKVVALALVVGSAGSAFLSAMQGRALALVNAADADQAKEAAKATGITALSLAPSMAADVAGKAATREAEAAKMASGEQVTLSADALPRSLALATDEGKGVTHAYAGVLGVKPSDVPVSDSKVAAGIVADAIDAIPGAVSSRVAEEVHDQMAPIIEQLQAL